MRVTDIFGEILSGILGRKRPAPVRILRGKDGPAIEFEGGSKESMLLPKQLSRRNPAFVAGLLYAVLRQYLGSEADPVLKALFAVLEAGAKKKAKKGASES